MKTKLVILLVIISLLLPTVLCACNAPTQGNGGANNAGSGGIFDPGAGRPGGFNPGEFNQGGVNQGGVNQGGQNQGGSNQSGRPDIPVENLDLLVLSYNRLENADLSFDFDFGFAESDAKGNVSLSSLLEQNDGSYKYYSVSPEDAGDPTIKYDYFKNEEDHLEQLSSSARRTADYMIENITVMGSVVSLGDTNYVLDYDAKTDTLYATTFFTNELGEICDISEIRIYYDEGGEETVEMFTLSATESSVDLNYVYYTAGKKYTITRGTVSPDGAFSDYHTTSAIKQDGMWRAVSLFFSPKNVLLTKDGEYDYANGLLYVSFLIETEDNVYTFADALCPFRDGGELGSGIVAESGDEVRILPYTLMIPGFSVDIYNGGGIHMGANVLTGWEECRLTIDADYELPIPPYSEHYFNTENDYILLENGIKLSGDFKRWSEEYGWGVTTATDDGEYFIDSEGNWHKIENGTVIASLTGGIIQINRAEGVMSSFNLSASGGCGKESYPERFAMLAKFFKAMGIGFASGISEDPFGDLSRLSAKRDIYTGKLFEALYGESYTFTGYKNSVTKIINGINGMKDGAIAKYSELYAKGAVDFDAQPRRPENIALINASSNLSGAALVSEGGIDFSSLTLTVAKSAILSEGASYKAIIALVSENDTIYLEGFDSAAYAHEAMTFRGKAIGLPTAECEGEYKLALFFAKISESDEAIRISDIAIPTVSDFAAFTVTKTSDGGYYEYNYSKKNGSLVFTSKFVDTEAPEIILDGAIGRTEGENPVYTLTIGEGTATVGDLISLISATDKYDGNITVTVLNVTLSGSEDALFENYSLNPDSAYVITVSDAAGNESSVTVNTVQIPSAPAEGENPPTE